MGSHLCKAEDDEYEPPPCPLEQRHLPVLYDEDPESESHGRRGTWGTSPWRKRKPSLRRKTWDASRSGKEIKRLRRKTWDASRSGKDTKRLLNLLPPPASSDESFDTILEEETHEDPPVTYEDVLETYENLQETYKDLQEQYHEIREQSFSPEPKRFPGSPGSRDQIPDPPRIPSPPRSDERLPSSPYSSAERVSSSPGGLDHVSDSPRITQLSSGGAAVPGEIRILINGVQVDKKRHRRLVDVLFGNENEDISESDDISTLEETFAECEMLAESLAGGFDDSLTMGPDTSDEPSTSRHRRTETRRLRSDLKESKQEATELRQKIRKKRRKRDAHRSAQTQGSSISEEINFEAEDVRYSNLKFSADKVSLLWDDEYFSIANIDIYDPTSLDTCDLSPSGQAFVKDFIDKSIRPRDAVLVWQAMWLSEHKHIPLVEVLTDTCSSGTTGNKSYLNTGWAGHFLLWKESKFVFVDFVLHQFVNPSISDDEIQKLLDIVDARSLESLFSSLHARGIPIRSLGPYFFSKGVSVDALCIYQSRGAPTPGTLLHALASSEDLDDGHIEATADCLLQSISGASAFDEFVMNWNRNDEEYDVFYMLFLHYGHQLHISEYDVQLVSRAKRKEKAANRMTKRMLNKKGIAQMKIFLLIFSFSNVSKWDSYLNGIASC